LKRGVILRIDMTDEGMMNPQEEKEGGNSPHPYRVDVF
jgi:hypothetical protein